MRAQSLRFCTKLIGPDADWVEDFSAIEGMRPDRAVSDGGQVEPDDPVFRIELERVLEAPLRGRVVVE